MRAPTTLRSTCVLTKKPTSPSVSTRCRFAIGTPIRTSCCPVQRASSTCQPANRAANSVARCPSARWRSDFTSAGGSSTVCCAARSRASAERGRSIGSCSTGCPAPSWAVQYASCRACSPAARPWRCQRA
ncbi:hypothetical protein ASC88_11385 [Rhizobacter sp. Root29]|nr:hypothetical protein ASC88_11385 [Rhizobacter sp. Root29]